MNNELQILGVLLEDMLPGKCVTFPNGYTCTNDCETKVFPKGSTLVSHPRKRSRFITLEEKSKLDEEANPTDKETNDQ